MNRNILVLREEKEYRKLFIAGIVNGIGDWFSQIAILTLLLMITGSGLAVGITLAIRLVPFLIFGPIGGIIADRFSRKKIMIVTDIIRAGLALALIFVDSPEKIWIVYVTSFLSSICGAVYSPARNSLFPMLVQKNNWLQVNALEQVMLGVVLVIGAISGGIFASLLGVNAIFILNSVSFLIATIIISKITIAENEITVQHQKEETTPSKIPSFKEIFIFVSRSALLRAMIVLFALWPIGDGIVNLLVSVYAVQVFNMEHIGVGIFYGALGLGLVLSSGITSKISKNVKLVVIIVLILEGVANMLLSQSSNFWVASIFLIVGTLFGGVGVACNQTLIMKNVPSQYLGRFFGLITTMENTIMGTVMALSGFLLSWIEPRTLGFFAGLFFTIVGVCLAPVIIKVKEEEPNNVIENTN